VDLSTYFGHRGNLKNDIFSTRPPAQKHRSTEAQKQKHRSMGKSTIKAQMHGIKEACKQRSLEEWKFGRKSLRFEREKMKLG